MSQLIYEVVYYNKFIPKDIVEIAREILTIKHGKQICNILKKDCNIQSWSNTYDFLNTKQENPNGYPEVIQKIMKSYLDNKEWRTYISKNLCPKSAPFYNQKTRRCVKSCSKTKKTKKHTRSSKCDE
jgi:hypothetical protein